MVNSRELDKYFRKVSNVNIQPTKAFEVDSMVIERLNNYVSKKLEDNRRERIASEIDAKDVVVGGKVLKK